MKRPLALVGFTYLLAQAVAVFFGYDIALWCAAGCGIIFLVSLGVPVLRKEKAVPIACLVAAMALGVYCLAQAQRIQPLKAVDGKDAVISGVICELPYETNQRYYYEIQTDRVELEGAPQRVKLRVSSTHALEAQAFDRITARVHFYAPKGGSGLTSSTYYQSKGIYMLAYLYEYEEMTVEPGNSRPPYYYALACRQALVKEIRRLLPPEHAGIAAGVLLGEKQGVPEQVKTDFQEIGVSHLLSVSGLHMTIIMQCLLSFFTLLHLKKRAAAMLSIGGVLCFMAVTGFAPSVVRAGVMSILLLAGVVLRKEPDTLNSLGAAVLVLALSNPFAAGDVGLLLSFSSTLGLILLSGKLIRRWQSAIERVPFGKQVLRGIGTSLAATLAATLFTIPVILLTFRSFSLIAPLSNLLLVLPAMVMMACTAVAALLSLTGIFSFLAMPIALAAGVLINFCRGCASLLAQIPFASIETGQRFLLLWLAGSLILLAIAAWKPETRRLKTAALLCALLLIVGGVSYACFRSDIVQVAVLDTGDGCTVAVSYRGQGAVVSCGGSRYAAAAAERYLRERNIRTLDYMTLPATGDKANNGAQTLIEAFHPRTLYLPESAQKEEKLLGSMKAAENAYLYSGRTEAKLWDRVTLSADTEEGWATMGIGGLRVVILPEGGSLLPELARDCHFFITGAPDAQEGEVFCDYLILSVSEETAKKGIRGYTPGTGAPLLTASQGNLYIECDSNGIVSVRRD